MHKTITDKETLSKQAGNLLVCSFYARTLQLASSALQKRRLFKSGNYPVDSNEPVKIERLQNSAEKGSFSNFFRPRSNNLQESNPIEISHSGGKTPTIHLDFGHPNSNSLQNQLAPVLEEAVREAVAAILNDSSLERRKGLV